MSNKQTTVNPYLTFDGNCREAMEFYKDALNGNLHTMPFGDAPMEVAEEHKNRVMHATLTFANAVIMASDNMPEQTVTHGNGSSISIAATDVEEGERYFNNLSKGGTVVMPYEKTFWGAKFGMCVDKFGVQWMINCELSQE